MIRGLRGMVLLTTMMMIVIVTLLVLSLMQGVFLYIKSTHQVMTNHQVLRQMETIANTLNISDIACVVHDENPNHQVDLLSAKQGCILSDDKQDYQYVVSNLGVFPCLQIVINDMPKGSQHWLVTIASMQPPKLILQLRVARPDEDSKCKLAKSRPIRSGVVSWRKI